MKTVITIEYGCPRCGGNHPAIPVFSLTHPFYGSKMAVVCTHWTFCENTLEPILVTLADVKNKIEFDVCPRCQAKHPMSKFKEFKHGFAKMKDVTYKHWAYCPKFLEPILMGDIVIKKRV